MTATTLQPHQASAFLLTAETLEAAVVLACTAVSAATLRRAWQYHRRNAALGADSASLLWSWMAVRTEAVLLLVQLVSLGIGLDRLVLDAGREWAGGGDPAAAWPRYLTYGTARTAMSVLVACKVLMNARDYRRIQREAAAALAAGCESSECPGKRGKC
jgi:hypothetical protein